MQNNSNKSIMVEYCVQKAVANFFVQIFSSLCLLICLLYEVYHLIMNSKGKKAPSGKRLILFLFFGCTFLIGLVLIFMMSPKVSGTFFTFSPVRTKLTLVSGSCILV